MDLVLANRDGQPNYIYFGSKFVKKITYGTGLDESRDVDVGDMDGDGQLDIVVANIGDRNMIYYGSKKGSYDRSKAFGDPAAATHSIMLADLDLNGNIDIVVGNKGQRNHYYLNNKKELMQYTFGQKDGATYGVTIGDLDGDVYPDIVTANSGGWNIIYYNRAPK